tara:strand:+ start:21236 stop:22417 length:1182 start_codon:yes stop_codon:yes gene_type:complete
MKEIHTDALIIGSGLVGLVAAHSLVSLGFKVTIIDKKKFSHSKVNNQDTRTVAVSEGSKEFLKSLSLWGQLEKYAEPIKTIKIFDQFYKNKIKFENEIRNNKLGYVVQNSILSKTLRESLTQYKSLQSLDGQDFNKISLKNELAITYLKKHKINSKLIIAADGKNSDIKKIVGNKTYKKNYNESALVINFNHKRKLNGEAYEIFYKTGPLAILPMKSSKKTSQSTVIWTNKDSFLQKLMSCKDDFVLNFMEEKIGNIVGEITNINSMQKFSLSAHINDYFFNKRLIYVGDSAHSIHPIAGQGWNLGVTDVKNLYQISKNLKYTKTDIGSDLFCKNYNQLSYYKAFQLFQITDKLNSYFKKDIRYYRYANSVGFNLINKAPVLKNKITKFAMGF